jgi:hypothetical protein
MLDVNHPPKSECVMVHWSNLQLILYRMNFPRMHLARTISKSAAIADWLHARHWRIFGENHLD